MCLERNEIRSELVLFVNMISTNIQPTVVYAIILKGIGAKSRLKNDAVKTMTIICQFIGVLM